MGKQNQCNGGKEGDIETGHTPAAAALYPNMAENPSFRWAFIRKVYSIILIQLLLTVAVASAFIFVRPISVFLFAGTPVSWAVLILIIIAPLISEFLIPFWWFSSSFFPLFLSNFYLDSGLFFRFILFEFYLFFIFKFILQLCFRCFISKSVIRSMFFCLDCSPFSWLAALDWHARPRAVNTITIQIFFFKVFFVISFGSF